MNSSSVIAINASLDSDLVAARIQAAADLVALRDVLNDVHIAIDMHDDDALRIARLDNEDTYSALRTIDPQEIYDATALPVYGSAGTEHDSKPGAEVWSWDDTSVLRYNPDWKYENNYAGPYSIEVIEAEEDEEAGDVSGVKVSELAKRFASHLEEDEAAAVEAFKTDAEAHAVLKSMIAGHGSLKSTLEKLGGDYADFGMEDGPLADAVREFLVAEAPAIVGPYSIEALPSVAFTNDADARMTLTEWVGTLVSVAYDRDRRPEGWEDISDEAGLNALLGELGGIYPAARFRNEGAEDGALQSAIVEFLEATTLDYIAVADDAEAEEVAKNAAFDAEMEKDKAAMRADAEEAGNAALAAAARAALDAAGYDRLNDEGAFAAIAADMIEGVEQNHMYNNADVSAAEDWAQWGSGYDVIVVYGEGKEMFRHETIRHGVALAIEAGMEKRLAAVAEYAAE